MVSVIIVLATIAMLILPLGRLYASWQKHRGNPKFLNPEFMQKFMVTRRIISIVLFIAALLILMVLE